MPSNGADVQDPYTVFLIRKIQSNTEGMPRVLQNEDYDIRT